MEIRRRSKSNKDFESIEIHLLSALRREPLLHSSWIFSLRKKDRPSVLRVQLRSENIVITDHAAKNRNSKTRSRLGWGSGSRSRPRSGSWPKSRSCLDVEGEFGDYLSLIYSHLQTTFLLVK